MDSIVFWGFNLYAWITIATVLSMFTVLLFTKLRADLVFLGAMGILFVTGVLNAKEAFSGFSSTSVVVIGVLFVVVAGLTHTGVLQWIVKHSNIFYLQFWEITDTIQIKQVNKI